MLTLKTFLSNAATYLNIQIPDEIIRSNNYHNMSVNLKGFKNVYS